MDLQTARALIISAKAGDTSARDSLITSIVKDVVPGLARKWGRLDFEEASAVGALAAVEAVNRALANWDEQQGSGLINYCTTAIHRALGIASDARGTIVSVPADTRQQQRKLRSGKTFSARTTTRLSRIHKSDRSLSEPIGESGGDGDEEGELRLIETIRDVDAADVEHDVALRECRAHLRELILSLFSKPRDQQIFEQLYFEDKTAPEVAAQFDISLATVKSVRQTGLKQLRHMPGLQDFLRLHVVGPRLVGRLRLPTLPPPDAQAGKKPANIRTKLTPETAAEIRKLRAEGMSNNAIAKLFDISPAAASMAGRGKSWRTAP